MYFVLIGIPLGSIAALTLGVESIRGDGWLGRWWLLLAGVLVAGAVASTLYDSSHRGDGVTDMALATGTLICVGASALILAFYAAVGMFIGSGSVDRSAVVAVVGAWLVLAVPIAIAMVGLTIVAAQHISCGPDAYECPF
jgi:hypothetical protein